MELENRALVLDLVEWVSKGPRTYEEVMAAWRTSCPRLTIWEDAVDHGLVARFCGRDGDACVAATEKGLALLCEEGRRRPDRPALQQCRAAERERRWN